MAIIIDGKIEQDYSDYFLNECNRISIAELRRIVDGDLSAFPEHPIDMEAFNSEKSFILEHVFEKYINRIIHHNELEISEGLLFDVLKYWENQSWRLGISNFIGNAAIQNCFDEKIYKFLIDTYLDEGDWAYKQICMRIILNSERAFDPEKLINEISRLHTYWAFYEIIPKMTIEQKIELYKNAHKKSFLTKSQRHELRGFLRGHFNESKIVLPKVQIEH